MKVQKKGASKSSIERAAASVAKEVVEFLANTSLAFSAFTEAARPELAKLSDDDYGYGEAARAAEREILATAGPQIRKAIVEILTTADRYRP